LLAESQAARALALRLPVAGPGSDSEAVRAWSLPASQCPSHTILLSVNQNPPIPPGSGSASAASQADRSLSHGAARRHGEGGSDQEGLCDWGRRDS
jgi:hypothetical protein